MATMGNLFSGSGAWELAAKMCGIDVVFEAEIEPFPVAVEAKRFPEAIQLGDVSKINGADIPPVDILTNSSPCQDLSVAKFGRSGLDSERSGLFLEAVRIAKEMREHDRSIRGADDVRPRFWCFENVPGIFSSSRGEDFRTVLEEIARISDPTAVIPRPPKGKWSYAGVVDGDGWQIAWRTMDSKFWGVPQRRKRVFIVASLNDRSAAEILFERARITWDFAQVVSAWKTSGRSLAERIEDASRVIGGDVRAEEDRVVDGVKKNFGFTTTTRQTRDLPCATITLTQLKPDTEQGEDIHLLFFNKNRNEQYDEEAVSMSVIARFGTGGNNMPIILSPKMNEGRR